MPKYGKYHTKPQDKRFVSEFIKTGNATQSAVVAYTKNRNSASAIGYRKLRNKDIQAQITEAMRSADINPEFIVKTRKRIIDKGMADLNDVRVTPADIAKNLEGLEKLMGIVESGKKQISHLHLYNLPHSEVEEHYNSQHKYFDQLKHEAIEPDQA